MFCVPQNSNLLEFVQLKVNFLFQCSFLYFFDLKLSVIHKKQVYGNLLDADVLIRQLLLCVLFSVAQNSNMLEFVQLKVKLLVPIIIFILL